MSNYTHEQIEKGAVALRDEFCNANVLGFGMGICRKILNDILSKMGSTPDTSAKVDVDTSVLFGDLKEHAMNCPDRGAPNWQKGNCTCHLEWRIKYATEREMHNAWRKRAEEAEAALQAPRSDTSAKVDEDALARGVNAMQDYYDGQNIPTDFGDDPQHDRNALRAALAAAQQES
jgi:hypothetical protein